MQTLKQLAIAGFIFACVFLIGFGVRDNQWQVKHNDYIQEQAKAAEETQRRLDDDLAAIGIKHEQEREHEQKIIDGLRAGLRDGTVRLRQAKAQCSANEDQRTGMGDVERAEPGDSEQELGQDVLDLAEQTKTAIAQRDALQEIIRTNNEGVE